MKPSIYTTLRDLISHKVEKLGEHGAIVHFDYPDCTRSFDGRDWTVVAKPAFIKSLNDSLQAVGANSFFGEKMFPGFGQE